MARRNNAAQMPPIGSELVDQNAVSTVTRWINELASGDGGAPPAGLDAGGPEASGPARLDGGSMAEEPPSDASLGDASSAGDAASL